MIKNTQNEAVQYSCQRRISRLKDERRYHQIVLERHKILSMMETSELDIVKQACRERFNQLILELETLQLEDHDIDGDSDDNTTAAKEDSQWYERVLQYLDGIGEMEERSVATKPVASPSTPLAGGRNCNLSDRERRQLWEDSSQCILSNHYPPEQNQYRSGSQVRFPDGPCSPQVRYQYNDNGRRAPFSPRNNDTTRQSPQGRFDGYNDSYFLSPRSDRTRPGQGSHPAANAVKSKTHWFGIGLNDL